MRQPRSILRRVGPGFIMASVVLGPGSIVAASNAGAQAEYRLLWVLASAAVLMAVYTAMGARLGCALDTTPLDYVARRAGRWLAVAAGVSGFLVAAGFQFGNNLGVSLALNGLLGEQDWLPPWIWPLVFTGLALLFLWRAKRFYQTLERLMMALVGVMILAFVVNLFWTGISPRSVVQGLVPRLDKDDMVTVAAMTATTFSVVGAFYQTYLVRAKGWKREDLGTAVGDAWMGIAAVGLISSVILIGAAETLSGAGSSFTNIGDVARQFKGILGNASNAVFCCGLAAAAFSSFIVNALVGGGLLADGLGLDPRVGSTGTKWCASAAMVLGCLVAVATVTIGGATKTTSLILAQASTLIAVPVCGALLLYLTSSKKVMGDLRNSMITVLLGIAGLAVVIWLAYGTVLRLVGQLGALFS